MSPSAGQFVLKDDGTFGLKSDGTFAVYDASGECSDCCGETGCCAYNAGLPRNSVIADLSTTPVTVEPVGSFYQSIHNDISGLGTDERIANIPDLSAYAALEDLTIGTAGGCVETVSFSCVYTNAGTEFIDGILNVTFDVRIGFVFHLDFNAGLIVGQMDAGTPPEFQTGTIVTWGDAAKMPSVTCDETDITEAMGLAIALWDSLVGGMASGRHIPEATADGTDVATGGGVTTTRDMDIDLTLEMRDGGGNLLTPAECAATLAAALAAIGC
jgi:hypothetical protein